jgi:D-glycero-D-manno-heptose 1,7-bisphosphate phosphatase
MIRAIFLDRDGTLIRDFDGEPPRTPELVQFFPSIIGVLQRLMDVGFELFLVSNQPDFAKGKSTMEELEAVHKKFCCDLFDNGIHFREFFYCFHKAEDNCACRKPKPYFILESAKKYNIDLSKSWMIGNRGADILCGLEAGTETILVTDTYPLSKAVELILHAGTKRSD